MTPEVLKTNKPWAVGYMLCVSCGCEGRRKLHVYYLPALPAECPCCGDMACWPREPRGDEMLPETDEEEA